jgi:DNA-binding PadR family transcriptional regulator
VADNARGVLLGFLAHEDLSGYDLKKRVSGSVGKFWDMGYGQIYPELKELEREGLVVALPGGRGKGPERTAYRITGEGRAHLARWLRDPGEGERLRFEAMLKLFFGGALTAEENARRVERFGERHRDELEEILQFKRNLEGAPGEADHLYYYLTVLFGERIHRACLEWAQEARGIIETRAEEGGETRDPPAIET